MSLESQSAAGTRAQEALDALSEAFATLEREYFQAWRECPQRDTEGRERLYMACQIVQKVHTELRNVADAGKVARSHIEGIRGHGEKRKIFGIV